MTVETKLSLKTGQSGCGEVSVSFDMSSLTAKYEYRSDGSDHIGGLLFGRVVKFQFESEVVASTIPEGSFDALVRISNSQWLEDVVSRRQGIRGLDQVEHYAVFFSNNGLLQVLSRDVSEISVIPGRL